MSAGSGAALMSCVREGSLEPPYRPPHVEPPRHGKCHEYPGAEVLEAFTSSTYLRPLLVIRLFLGTPTPA